MEKMNLEFKPFYSWPIFYLCYLIQFSSVQSVSCV